MAPINAIRGTGEEISRYVGGHPTEEFLLVSLEPRATLPKFDEARWDETMALIDGFRGKFPVLSDEAFSTDSIYD